MKCLICKKEYKNITGLGVHIVKLHKITTQEYYNNFFLQNDENLCKICKNLTTFINMSKGYSKYCSQKCAGNDEERNKKVSIAKKKWHKNPENKERMRQAALKEWSNPKSLIKKKLQSDEFRKKCSKRNKRLFNDENFRKKHAAGIKKSWTPERKKQNSIFMKKEWATSRLDLREKQREDMKNGNAAWLNMFIKNPSKPQVELFNKCQKLFPYPIMNYPICGYSIDIAIPSLNIAIEYDGSYWHQDNDRDKRRQKKIEQDGWKFLRYIDYIPSSRTLLNDVNKEIKER